MKSCHFSLILTLLAVSLLLTACGFPLAPDPTATAIPPTLPLAQPTIIVVDGTPQSILQPFIPTPTPNLSQPNPVQITELQYFQVENRLVIVAKLLNTYPDAILRDVQIEVLALDSVGTRIAQEFTALKYLFPRETTGLVQTFDLMSGLVAATVEVRIYGGVVDRDLKYAQPLNISNPAGFALQNDVTLTGWLDNKDPYTYTQVALHAIAYNAFGEIIGGGKGLADFVPQNDRIGVSIPAMINPVQRALPTEVTPGPEPTETPIPEPDDPAEADLTELPATQTPEPTLAPTATALDEQIARVEIYPWITSYSASLEGGTWWDTIKIDDWGFVVNEYGELGGGAVLRNRADNLLTETYYIVTVFNDADRVCLVETGYIDLIWPKEEVLFSPGIPQLPAAEGCGGVDMVIVPGEFGDNPLQYNPLLTSQPVLLDPTAVRVTVINNLNTEVPASVVHVLFRDASGAIVGGGSQAAGPVRSGSPLQVDVPVSFLGEMDELTIQSYVTLPVSATLGQ